MHKKEVLRLILKLVTKYNSMSLAQIMMKQDDNDSQ